MELIIREFLQVSARHLSTTFRGFTIMSAVELDIQKFISQTQDDVPSDVSVLTPEGEYPMYVKPGSTQIIFGISEKGPWAMYVARVVVDDPSVRELTNLENPGARIRLFLDVTEDSTEEQITLVKGANRNTSLGKLLKATGNDKQGWTYGAIEGVPFKGRVIHKADDRDATRKNVEVSAFAKL
jgi:hypothetical protein